MKKYCFNDLKTFSIMTLGCKVNSYESNIIQNDLLSYGLIKVPFGEPSDITIINTCSVTNTADAKSRNFINRVNKTNPDSIVLVCGCYSQVASNDLKKDFGIDILIGNKYKNNVIELINEYFNNHKQVVKIDNLLLEKEFENNQVEVYKDKTRAFVKIQDGCNYMCSYCIIPFTRGRQRSKNFTFLINEITTLVSNGYKEIVLTGVNTAGYNYETKNFYDLLLAINNLAGDFRVRISSLEPFQINDDIIKLIATNPSRFAPHWHICLQSGNDSVLQAMNRKYTTNEFLTLVQKIYSLNPQTAISTDYICGFPTETDLDHQDSIEFVKQVGFLKLHVFPYSPRKFTPAAKLHQVHDANKTVRVNEMLKISEQLTNQFIKKFIDKDVWVLFEKYEHQINSGYSGQYFIVNVQSNINYNNQLKKVRVKKVIFDQVFGEIIE
mgnify:CR=1 FL=1